MKRLIFIVITILFFSISFFAQPKYEFRGVWIATVDNIDWPSRGNFDSEKQKAEFISILDMHQRNGMNVMVVQVRPAADAFYPSPYEPWSQWLTGIQGKPPSPYYDPLKFMIEETHKRGMEFHAWINPYRAVFDIKKPNIASNHITRIHREWFLTYGTKRYFDPGNKEVQKFVENVVRDIVKRYDIDAIHMDDYFYPYRIDGKEFPDAATYKKSGSKLSKGDWRRSNTDSIIKRLSRAIKEEKKYCRFGISPFSVWRNKSTDPERGSDTDAGQTNYDDLYADILLWLEKGWIDYVTPQLYFEIGHSKVDYTTMLDWWSKYGFGRQIYIGHGIYRTANNEKAWKNPNELPREIQLLRTYPEVQGSIYFSSINFNSNPNGWNDSLKNNYYKYPAIVPPMSWIDNQKPWAPVVEKKVSKENILELKVKPDPRNNVAINYYIVYKLNAAKPTDKFGNLPQFIERIIVQPKGFEFKETLSSTANAYRYMVTAVSKNNNESNLGEIISVNKVGGKWVMN